MKAVTPSGPPRRAAESARTLALDAANVLAPPLADGALQLGKRAVQAHRTLELLQVAALVLAGWYGLAGHELCNFA